ncbi:MAG: AAA family ATPase [Rhizobiales bacterium]|nr:AAA family ATPase [Hyphomicrobiales bacterium]
MTASDALIETARSVPIEDVITRYGHKLRRSGQERIGPCPKCGGTDRFSINVKENVWHCRQCKPDSIAGDVIGLVEWLYGDKFEEAVERLTGEAFTPSHKANGHDRTANKAKAEAKPTLGPIVKVYDYQDENGELLFQVTRHDPKDFRQRRPDGMGGWIYNLDGVRLVPYRLPELIDAGDRTVFIVEGEKDVDNIIDVLGAPATCNPRGAGKWANCNIDGYFRNANVVIIADNDPQSRNKKTGKLLTHEDGRPRFAGWDHAVEVAQHLYPIASSVRVVDLKYIWQNCPDKGDITDWIKAGGTIEALYDIAERTPLWEPDQIARPSHPATLPLINIRAWHGTEPRPRQWLIENCIPDRNVTLLTGQGGVGKTLIMQQLSVATVLGKDWFQLLPEPGPVLFITAEDDVDEMHFRYHAIAKFYQTTFNALADAGLHLLSLAGRDSAMGVVNNRGIVEPTELWRTLVRTAQEIRPRWIALDTAADIFLVNERDRSEVRQCISLLRGLAIDVQTSIILLSHPSLTGISSGTGLSGSTAWHNSVRSRLYLQAERTHKKEHDADDAEDTVEPVIGTTRTLSFMKSNYSALAKDIRLEWKDGLFQIEQGLRGISPTERASLDQRAQTAFCEVLKRCNSQNIAVSPKERANNFAVKQFVDAPEVKALHPQRETRRKLLAKAYKVLLASGDLFVKSGPEGLPVSKQYECLYLGKRLL